MNAKKIMGAVLVALLAAALFVGAGAAEVTDKGVVYTYVDLNGDGFELGQTFTAEDGSAPIMTQNFLSGGFGFAVENPSSGYYTNGTVKFKLLPPTAVISIVDEDGKSVVGGTVDAGEDLVIGIGVDKMIAANAGNIEIIFITPDQAVVTTFTGWDATNKTIETQNIPSGKWGVKLNISAVVAKGGPKYTEPVYFTVVNAEDVDAAITVDKDTVLTNGVILVTVNKDGVITYDAAYLDPVDNQVGMTGNTVKKGTYAFTAIKKGETTLTFTAGEETAEVDITIENGVITAVADADAFFVGNPIKLSGTTTAGGDKLYFYIEGTNYGFKAFSNDQTKNFKLADGKWSVELDSKIVNEQKTLVAGTTYTIFVTNDAATFTNKEDLMQKTYATVAVTMKQPFITNVEIPAVAVQGTDLEITGVAEAAKNVKLYVFGTSFFYATEQTIAAKANGKFEFTMPVTTDMAPGTYFYLIQHPMNDGVFNVWNGSVEDGDADEALYAALSSGSDADFFYAATGADSSSFIFNAWKRGTNYAAQALIDEISGQNIDDIFVQGSFKVDVPKLQIDALPSEVVKGSKLVISGTTNAAEGADVIVNVYAGTFGANVKGDVNQAAFLTEKAKTQKDGIWTVTVDTSKLNVGEYTASVLLNGKEFDSANIKVVDAADEPETPVTPEQPEQPEQPEEPVAPATPGFGALAALAGLGAVAVLLLRRE